MSGSTRRLRGIVLSALAALVFPGPSEAQTVEYFHLDAIGNVRAVTDQNGTVLERHDYLPFGEELCGTVPCAAVPGQPRRFTGKERDDETGLDYFGARYYRSNIGRFTTIDPIYTWRENLLDPQRWNRYAYGRNNPLRYIDPDGREVVSVMDGKMYGLGTEIMAPATVAEGNAAFAVLVGIASLGLPDPTDVALAPIAARLGVLIGRALGKAGEAGDITSRSKTAAEMAEDLSGRIGKNSVPFETPSTKGHIDLKGKGHFDKATGQEIPTPHVQTRPKHVGPQGQVNLGPQTTKPATKADIRTAEKLVDRKQQ